MSVLEIKAKLSLTLQRGQRLQLGGTLRTAQGRAVAGEPAPATGFGLFPTERPSIPAPGSGFGFGDRMHLAIHRRRAFSILEYVL